MHVSKPGQGTKTSYSVFLTSLSSPVNPALEGFCSVEDVQNTVELDFELLATRPTRKYRKISTMILEEPRAFFNSKTI